MLGRIILLVVASALLVAGAPVTISETIRARVPTKEVKSSYFAKHDVLQRSPIIEPIPSSTVAVNARGAEVGDEDEVGTTEVIHIDARAVTKPNGNSGRGITKPKGNSGRGITKPKGNSGRGITKPKGNSGRGITKPKGNSG